MEPNQIQNQTSNIEPQNHSQNQTHTENHTQNLPEHNSPIKMDLQSEDQPQNQHSQQSNTKKCAANFYVFEKNFFVERSFHESFDGFYDEEDFYHTPEGSFFNQNLEYFNRFGFDRYGGRYTAMGVYIPGEGWNSQFQCYEEDLDAEMLKQQMHEIESVFEDQIQIAGANFCNMSLDSEEIKEQEELENFESQQQQSDDFLKVQEVMDAQAREEAEKASVEVEVKNQHQQDDMIESEISVGLSAVKSQVCASASKIVNNGLIGNASQVKASAAKAYFNADNNANDFNTENNLSFNNAQFSVNMNSQQQFNGNNSVIKNNPEFNLGGLSQSANLQQDANANYNNNNFNFSEAGNNSDYHQVASGVENAVNVGVNNNSLPTPVKNNYMHEPTPFKIPNAEQSQKIDV